MKKLLYILCCSLAVLVTSCENEEPKSPDDSTSGSGISLGHAYVDLGLPSGTKWAKMNVGADSPEDYGDYFAWGETTTKSVYSWGTYKWYEGGYYTLTKYCTDSCFGIVDNKTILELSDDAANASWGGDWRMPTKEDQDELRAQCAWDWTTKNGVNGYTVTGPNGNSIFLPAAGYRDYSDLYSAGSGGYYWGSSLDANFVGDVCGPYFDSRYVGGYYGARYYGRSVRPVLAK